jgi:hypothetical protein
MKRGYEVLSVIACFISSGDIEINISPVVVDTYSIKYFDNNQFLEKY